MDNGQRMIRPTNWRASTIREDFLVKAESFAGYRAQPNLANPFSAASGYPNRDWNGAFIDYCAREAGLHLPALTNPASAMQYFLLHKRNRAHPTAGDLVFYAFASPGTQYGAGAPHTGIVINTEKWKTDRTIVALEAQIASGLPRASKDNDGVFLRTRYETEILLFARPNFTNKANTEKDAKRNTEELPSVRLSHFQPNKRHASVEVLQTALAFHPATLLYDSDRGLFDRKTRAAYAALQRHYGYIGTDATGQPDANSLSRLASEIGGFTVAG